MRRAIVSLMVGLFICDTDAFLRIRLDDCIREKEDCERALEKVPPSEFRRIADELAECKQHLEESTEKREC